MEIKIIEWNSKQYQELLELRDELLRKPLGMSIKDDNLEAEKNCLHIGCFDDGELVGTCYYKPINDTTMQMKQVAVKQTKQRMNIGSTMFLQTLELLKLRSITTINVHARINALGFYEKLGFIVDGEPFEEVGITHYCMNYTIKQ